MKIMSQKSYDVAEHLFKVKPAIGIEFFRQLVVSLCFLNVFVASNKSLASVSVRELRSVLASFTY